MMDSVEEEGHRRKRPRKSRGRGLRTRTGCLTCRKRHKKCDEKQPVCGPCTVSSRHCVFPHDLDAQSALEALTRSGIPLVNQQQPQPSQQQQQQQPPPLHVRHQSNISSHSNIHSDAITSHTHSPSATSHSPGIILPPHPNEVTAATTPGSTSQLSDGRPPPLPPHVTAAPPRSHPEHPLPPGPAQHHYDVNLPPGVSVPKQPQQFDTASIGRSPDTLSYENWTADFASTRWLDLLANDAAQADSGFSLAPSPEPESRGGPGLRHSAISTHVSPALLNGQAQLPENLDPESERRAWQSEHDITLTDHEADLFRHFAEKCAQWLDLFDSKRLFSTYAIRLALQNVGLMKAILALATKHRSKCCLYETTVKKEKQTPSVPVAPVAQQSATTTARTDEQGGSNGNTSAPATEAAEGAEDSEWIRYYYETLHYVREALAYSSYTHSEELLATAIVISAYEMLDESDGTGNWQRHLKGVFWIQRSQDVDGGCGGLRQAVWWAWLRQDVWAAFREKRPCLSFWRPVKDVKELDQHELADRAIYLLSQAVNFSAESRKADAIMASHIISSSSPTAATSPPSLDPATAMHRRRVRDELVAKMDRWKACLGDQYTTLPTSRRPGDVFTRLWVHPPQFGAALQAYSFAQILVTLHGPSTPGFAGFLKTQRTLAEAVETICGIAMELQDESCQVLSAECLYGAGLCVHDPAKRDKIISMMEDCERRIGWAPMSTWRDDLRLEWVKADGGTP